MAVSLWMDVCHSIGEPNNTVTGTPVAVGGEEASMRSFLELTVDDMRAGRESWRVVALVSGLASAAAALFLWW